MMHINRANLAKRLRYAQRFLKVLVFGQDVRFRGWHMEMR